MIACEVILCSLEFHRKGEGPVSLYEPVKRRILSEGLSGHFDPEGSPSGGLSPPLQ